MGNSIRTETFYVYRGCLRRFLIAFVNGAAFSGRRQSLRERSWSREELFLVSRFGSRP